ncbi:MAG TPA: hypothetical protein VIP57_12995 [Candidatus Dormibacteraeota bacterium]
MHDREPNLVRPTSARVAIDFSGRCRFAATDTNRIAHPGTDSTKARGQAGSARATAYLERSGARV